MTELTEQATRLGLLDANLQQLFDVIERQRQEIARLEMKLGGYKAAHDQAEQELDSLTREKDLQKTIEALAKTVDLAGLAREAVLHQKLAFAIELIDDYYAHEKREFLAVLAQPSDDSALQDALFMERNSAIEEYRKVSDAVFNARLKAARAAERERRIHALEDSDTCGSCFVQDAAISAIRALGDE